MCMLLLTFKLRLSRRFDDGFPTSKAAADFVFLLDFFPSPSFTTSPPSAPWMHIVKPVQMVVHSAASSGGCTPSSWFRWLYTQQLVQMVIHPAAGSGGCTPSSAAAGSGGCTPSSWFRWLYTQQLVQVVVHPAAGSGGCTPSSWFRWLYT